MIHFSCDICGRKIENGERRYRVVIEVEERDTDGEEYEDNFCDETQNDMEPIEGGEYHQFRFDLCEDCAVVYIASPLPTTFQRFRISDN